MTQSKPSIAIVEDDSDQLHSIEEFLLDSGYSVWGAGSAEAFYKGFTVQPVDVVLLDLGLPGEDGLSVASLLKSRPEVGVIILSARDSLDDRLAGMRAGADRYLVKPVNLLELAANIDATASRLAPRTAIDPAGSLVAATIPVAKAACWVLAMKDWVLSSPQGKCLQLTTHEFMFLQQLLRADGQPVPKRDLSTHLFGARAQNGAERLNLLLTRLRKKAAEAFSEPLPVKTLHQIGYAFTASAQLVQDTQRLH
ncbi:MULTISPECIES: response regulator transcription factor [unclassified Acidovorax]|uniref:response regulator transcription factor n=1 Tax=unclassified Acidovorax TaxID=2684926 RepID=UPI000C199A29|nr:MULTISPECIES: response regulator transcription factor [unclassified Acidovorax]PIF16409.1 DNA-binding response OmpR family regulator [Acidovorax sp. 59]PKW04566.1 DNA-binding response OmpR family regulator [Acidovorax sp. 30]